MNALNKTIFIKAIPRLSAVLVSLIFTGCAAVGPNYVPPEKSVSEEWHTALNGGLTSGEMDPKTLAAWWTTLNDPELSSLVNRAVAGDLDLKKARARVRQARAQRGMAMSDLYPTLSTADSVIWRRTSQDPGAGRTSDLFSSSFDAGWELDVFGGVRRSVEAANADLQASEEDLRNVLVSLLAEVALNYVEVRTFQERIAVAEANMKTQNETYQLTQWQYQAGLSDELAVQQARYNLENTRSQIPTLRIGLEEAKNRLAVLLGEQPGTVHTELEERKPIPVPPLEVAVGVPADVLRRRPDVCQAERQLAAQTARVGVATAELYPKFMLLGSIGLESNLSFSGPWTLSGGPEITWDIFKGGAIRENIKAQSALQEQYLIAYEVAVLGALEEVENVLVAYQEVQLRRQSLSEATQAAQRAVELAQHKYQAGSTDFNNVLDAERSLLSYQEQLAQNAGTITSDLIRLYKVMGGGWTSLAGDVKK